MKKLSVILLALMLVLVPAAMAAEFHPIQQEDMTDLNGIHDVTLDAADVTGETITATIYEVDYFDFGEQIPQVGDTIYVEGEPFEVETVVEEDGMIQINGGYDENGVSLAPEGGAWVSVGWDLPTYTARGTVTLPLAETVTLSVYDMDEYMNPLGGYTDIEVDAEELASVLSHNEAFAGIFPVGSINISVTDGAVTLIRINYVP